MNPGAPVPVSTTPTPVLCLNRAARGQHVRISHVQAGRCARLRLAAMGLLPGTPLTVMRAAARGPVVVAVRGARLALGRGLASAVMVVPEAS